MVRFFDNREIYHNECLDALTSLYPGLYVRVPVEMGNHQAIMRTDCRNRVSIVVGSGAGNNPWCFGYVGEGMADAAVQGPVYTAPSARAIQKVTRAVPHKDGVLYICTNNFGDVMNFELAGELVEMEGIRTYTVKVSDDISTAARESKDQYRGTAGVLLVVKAAGGAALQNMNLEDVARIAGKANDNTYTFNVLASPMRDPGTDHLILDVKRGMLEFGAGFSGEPGVFRKRYNSVADTVDIVMKYLLNQIQPLPMEEVSLLVNGHGRTCMEELTVITSHIVRVLHHNEINLHSYMVGHAYSPADSTGFSVSLIGLDEELKWCLDMPSKAPLTSTLIREVYAEGIRS